MESATGYDEKLIENEKLVEGLKEKAQELGRDVIISMGVGVAGHIEGSNSSADMVAALYLRKMKRDPKNLKWRERDRFLLSKGHIGILQYAALAESGYSPVGGLKHTKGIGSYLQGRPDVQKTPSIEVGTGSLGQGLPIGLDMVLRRGLDHLDSRTYVLVGGGEITKGQIWRATTAASTFKADNLTAIVDRNQLQTNGKTKERFDTGDIMTKFLSFGWHVIEANRHDMRETLGALGKVETVRGMPTTIIANTIKGKDVSFAENVVGYRNRVLAEEIYRQTLQKLTEQE